MLVGVCFCEFGCSEMVILGHEDLWAGKSGRDSILDSPDMTEEDGRRAADLKVSFLKWMVIVRKLALVNYC